MISMEKKPKKEIEEIVPNEQTRLELINLAVLFRSSMIGLEEFEAKARSLGVSLSPETIFNLVPSLDLG